MVSCNEPDFSLFTCFDPDNIAALKTAIGEVKMSKTQRSKIDKIINKITP